LSSIAEIPPLLEVTRSIARNHRDSPVLVCSTIVPASSECCLPPAAHSSIGRAWCAQARSWPQAEQRNPPGPRTWNR
jgi:hypothetical protein